LIFPFSIISEYDYTHMCDCGCMVSEKVETLQLVATESFKYKATTTIIIFMDVFRDSTSVSHECTWCTVALA